ncbi:MAG: DUF2164 family protein [Actinobacteria bacterium]|nr:MAG: DUF2164 family protein [Actinomycetota bacterium]
MTKIKRSWDLISEEKRRATTKAIIDFFQTEHSEEIGIIAAENVLNFMLETLAPDIYNKGIEDTLNLVKKSFENMELDINALLKK